MSSLSTPPRRSAVAPTCLAARRYPRDATVLWRAALAAGGALAVLLATAAVARAGTFTIGDCPAAANHATTAGPWEPDWLNVPVGLKQECSGGPGDWIGLASNENGPLIEGVVVGTEGTPVTIVHLRMWWRAFGSPSGSAAAEVNAYNREGYAEPGWAQPNAGAIWDTTGGPQELEFPASENVGLLRIGERCTRPYGTSVTSCPTDNAFLYDGFPLTMQMYGAELTLSDDTPPSITLTGGPEGSAPIMGSIQMSFHATDPVGLTKSELLVDGTPVATHDYSSACSYTQMRPCPEGESDQFSIEGSSLPEGTHALAVRVTDAAGNTALSATRTVVTARPPVPNGVPCSGPAISVTADRESGAVTIPFGDRLSVEGRLACGGTPIPGARIDLESPAARGVPAPTLAVLQTVADGTFRYQLPVGPSRKLSLSYLAYSNEPSPAARATLQINVRPRITLNIRPRRTHNHGTVHWRGRIEGGPYPPAGIPMLVEVKEGGKRWNAFDQINVKNGTIKFPYTFLRTYEPATYTFRVALPAGGAVGYPYAFGASRPVKVHVRPAPGAAAAAAVAAQATFPHDGWFELAGSLNPVDEPLGQPLPSDALPFERLALALPQREGDTGPRRPATGA